MGQNGVICIFECSPGFISETKRLVVDELRCEHRRNVNGFLYWHHKLDPAPVSSFFVLSSVTAGVTEDGSSE